MNVMSPRLRTGDIFSEGRRRVRPLSNVTKNKSNNKIATFRARYTGKNKVRRKTMCDTSCTRRRKINLIKYSSLNLFLRTA